MDKTLELLFGIALVKWALWAVLFFWGVFLLQKGFANQKENPDKGFAGLLGMQQGSLLVFLMCLSVMIYGSIAETAWRPKTELMHEDIFSQQMDRADSQHLPQKVEVKEETSWEQQKQQNREENAQTRKDFMTE